MIFVISQFCLLYKLYTLKLTRKQVMGLLNHADSPYIRGLGFMYIRFSQPPADLFDWYEEYLQDEEEIDVKAGGGQAITIGQMCRQFLTKLDWFSTLFPRIPVPIQKQIEQKLNDYDRRNGIVNQPPPPPPQQRQQPIAASSNNESRRDRERYDRDRAPKDYQRRRYEDEARYSRKSRSRSRSREKHSSKSSKYYRDRSRSRSKERKDRSSRKYEYDEGRSSRRY